MPGELTVLHVPPSAGKHWKHGGTVVIFSHVPLQVVVNTPEALQPDPLVVSEFILWHVSFATLSANKPYVQTNAAIAIMLICFFIIV